MVPLRLDVLDRRIHADAVDRPVRRDRPDHDGDIEFAAAAVGHVGEQEGLALRFIHAADELPAHQRMQFGVLVDRPVDGEQKVALA